MSNFALIFKQRFLKNDQYHLGGTICDGLWETIARYGVAEADVDAEVLNQKRRDLLRQFSTDDKPGLNEAEKSLMNAKRLRAQAVFDRALQVLERESDPVAHLVDGFFGLCDMDVEWLKNEFADERAVGEGCDRIKDDLRQAMLEIGCDGENIKEVIDLFTFFDVGAILRVSNPFTKMEQKLKRPLSMQEESFLVDYMSIFFDGMRADFSVLAQAIVDDDPVDLGVDLADLQALGSGLVHHTRFVLRALRNAGATQLEAERWVAIFGHVDAVQTGGVRGSLKDYVESALASEGQTPLTQAECTFLETRYLPALWPDLVGNPNASFAPKDAKPPDASTATAPAPSAPKVAAAPAPAVGPKDDDAGVPPSPFSLHIPEHVRVRAVTASPVAGAASASSDPSSDEEDDEEPREEPSTTLAVAMGGNAPTAAPNLMSPRAKLLLLDTTVTLPVKGESSDDDSSTWGALRRELIAAHKAKVAGDSTAWDELSAELRKPRRVNRYEIYAETGRQLQLILRGLDRGPHALRLLRQCIDPNIANVADWLASL